jgi:YidC/Oxa1 family membrane protein insertase
LRVVRISNVIMRLILKIIAGTLLLFSFIPILSFQATADLLDFPQSHIAQRIHDQWVDIIWMPYQPEPSVWKVLATSDGDFSEWFSMQTPAKNTIGLTKHLRLHGKIDNLPIESTGNWMPIDKTIHPQTAVHQRIVGNGLLLEQSYALTENPYHLNIKFTLFNNSEKTFKPHPDDRIKLSVGPGLGNQHAEGLGYADSMYSFVDPVALLNGKVKRFHTKQIGTTIVPWSIADLDWLGLHGRYFAFLIAPAPPQQSLKEWVGPDQVSVHLENNEAAELPLNHLPVLSIELAINSILPGDKIEWDFIVYAGPKSMQSLNRGTFGFENLVFPGMWQWMRWLSFGLLWLMTSIHAVIPNWGAVILLLAIMVRLAMYPIAQKALASQRAFVSIQKQIQPELQLIKLNYRGEEQSERILNLYKQHGVSPLAGLKPLLIVLLQLPILVALFHVLGSAFELHRAPFLWIETLAEPDRLFALGFTIPFLGEYFNILPVFMALSTLAALKLSPTPAATSSAQRIQNIGLIFVAFVFFILFYPFPAGMVLYWTAANLLHIAQNKLL